MNNFLKKSLAMGIATGFCMLTSVSSALAIDIAIEKDPGGVEDIGGLISAGINAAIIIAALLTFVFLIWGGIQWLTSGGDKTAYEAARGRITAALIGLAIVASAFALMKIIEAFFGVNITDGITIKGANEY